MLDRGCLLRGEAPKFHLPRSKPCCSTIWTWQAATKQGSRLQSPCMKCQCLWSLGGWQRRQICQVRLLLFCFQIKWMYKGYDLAQYKRLLADS